MKLPAFLVARLRAHAYEVMCSRNPDRNIGGTKGDPYMCRWFARPVSKYHNRYVHFFRHSDDDRALHDHPYASMSILLQGAYYECSILPGGVHKKVLRTAGDITVRGAKAAHRIELLTREEAMHLLSPVEAKQWHNDHDALPCLSLFLTGPRVRDWGFHCKAGWVPWQQFTDPSDSGLSGPGCGEN